MPLGVRKMATPFCWRARLSLQRLTLQTLQHFPKGLLMNRVPLGILERFENGLRHRWVGMDAVDHVIERRLQLERDDALVDHVGDVGADHVDS